MKQNVTLNINNFCINALLSLCLFLLFSRNARLQLTDALIGEFSGKDQDTECDIHRIEQLLSQPRNEDTAKNNNSCSQ